MKKYFEVLKKCALFGNIGIEELPVLLDCLGARVISPGKNEFVFFEGEPAKDICIVLSGRVQIVRIDCCGNRSIISDIGPSRLFGEAYACADTENLPVSAVAAENSAIMLIDSRKITHMCKNSCGFHNQLVHNLLKIMAMKNIQINRKVEIISKRTTREKLLTYLTLEAKKNKNKNMRFTVPFDRQELADYLEVDRSGLSAEISRLRKEGIIRCRRSDFELLR
ncbi:MAG: Crp/Fnr family transcriptional regulator [Oscillospiraceae bacterium]